MHKRCRLSQRLPVGGLSRCRRHMFALTCSFACCRGYLHPLQCMYLGTERPLVQEVHYVSALVWLLMWHLGVARCRRQHINENTMSSAHADLRCNGAHVAAGTGAHRAARQLKPIKICCCLLQPYTAGTDLKAGWVAVQSFPLCWAVTRVVRSSCC